MATLTDKELLQRLIEAGERMRAKQAEYFKAAPTARRTILPLAKAAEATFDTVLFNCKQLIKS